tara:strand:- start:552 stop:773 length:222 start_codon:yes stop_codon:yes gene_type:complete
MNKTIERIQELTRAEINSKNIKLENIRKGKVINPFPIGAYNLFYLLKDGRLSLKAQAKMLDYFGFNWELKIIE